MYGYVNSVDSEGWVGGCALNIVFLVPPHLIPIYIMVANEGSFH